MYIRQPKKERSNHRPYMYLSFVLSLLCCNSTQAFEKCIFDNSGINHFKWEGDGGEKCRVKGFFNCDGTSFLF